MRYDIHWTPQPKQAQVLAACGLDQVFEGGHPRDAICETIGYGGAAFGGKSDGLLGIAIAAAFAYPGISIGYFRRTFPELEGADGAIIRSQELLAGVSRYNEQKHVHVFPTGSRLHFCHCQFESDVFQYQSQAFDILLIDEATHFTWSIVDYLITRNRSTIKDGPHPFRVFATNPGNVGHTWYLQLFDLLRGMGEHQQVKEVTNPNGSKEKTIFIPAFIQDNQIGVSRDPNYEARLMARDALVGKALLEGDWTVFAGQAFASWSYTRHTVDYQDLPDDWPTWRSLDYGWDHPWYCYWWKIDPNSNRHYTIRELHGRLQTDIEIANAIKTATLPNERILFTYASPDMWREKNLNGAVTTAPQEFARVGIVLTKAANDRVNGKRVINNFLANLPDGKPGVVVFRQCADLIKIMPSLVIDDKNTEDVLKVDGDDPYDAWRYGFTRSTAVVTPKREIKQRQSSLMELIR